MKAIIILLLATMISRSFCCDWPWNKKHLPTVPEVNLQKFSGTWYEIARLPFLWENNCYCVTSTFTMNPDKMSIKIHNACLRGGPDGKLVSDTYEAKAFDTKHNKFRVRYNWLLKNDLYVVNLGGDYEYTVLATPDRCKLWILSREPTFDSEELNRLLDSLLELDFELDALIYTYQGAQCPKREPDLWLSS